MVLNSIEKLLEKYDNAETTLQEEAQLKAYFTSNNVAPHLEHYKPLFTYFTVAQNEVSTKNVPLHTKKTKVYQWISVAAVTVLMLGIMIPQMLGPTEAEKQEALLAYNQTMEILSLVSFGLNQGKQQINAISLVSDNIDKASEKISVLGEFSKTKNKFLKTNNTK